MTINFIEREFEVVDEVFANFKLKPEDPDQVIIHAVEVNVDEPNAIVLLAVRDGSGENEETAIYIAQIAKSSWPDYFNVDHEDEPLHDHISWELVKKNPIKEA